MYVACRRLVISLHSYHIFDRANTRLDRTNMNLASKEGLSAFHRWVGFFLPLPLFIEPGSSILFATSALVEGNVAFPVSLLLLPFAMLWGGLKKYRLRKATAGPYVAFFFPFVFWSLVLAMYSSTVSLQSYLYAVQWSLPFFWFFYFVALREDRDLRSFLNGFVGGAFVGAAYTFAAGGLEILIYGSLQDSGRMTQNLVLPGHYQLYVYVPTVIAFATLTALALARAKVVEISRVRLAIFLVISFFSIAFTGAREGVLVYLIGVAGVTLIWSSRRISTLALVLGTVITAALILIIFDLTPAISLFENTRIVSKILDLSEQGKGYGGRDQMLALYLDVIEASPWVGSGMLPPSSSFLNLNVEAPSAHNYYVDAFAWGGIVNAILLAGLVLYITWLCMLCIARAFSSRAEHLKLDASMALLLLIFLYVSNNINVPLRQPLTGSVCVLLIYWIFERRWQND